MTDEHIDSYLDAVRCLGVERIRDGAQILKELGTLEAETKHDSSQRAFMTIVGIAIIFVVALTIVGAYIDLGAH